MRNALIAMPLFASALLAACTPTPSREAAEVKTVPLRHDSPERR